MQIKNITPDTFSNYGTVLMHTHNIQDNGYEKIAVMHSRGWIWALMTIQNKKIETLERHPNTRESFEPLNGVTLIVVASSDTPNDMSCFLLDTPVLLHADVWHQVLCLSQSASFKIVENKDVETEFFQLKTSMHASFNFE
jgi:ureidoglycolate hydrolase